MMAGACSNRGTDNIPCSSLASRLAETFATCIGKKLSDIITSLFYTVALTACMHNISAKYLAITGRPEVDLVRRLLLAAEKQGQAGSRRRQPHGTDHADRVLLPP